MPIYNTVQGEMPPLRGETLVIGIEYGAWIPDERRLLLEASFESLFTQVFLRIWQDQERDDYLQAYARLQLPGQAPEILELGARFVLLDVQSGSMIKKVALALGAFASIVTVPYLVGIASSATVTYADRYIFADTNGSQGLSAKELQGRCKSVDIASMSTEELLALHSFCQVTANTPGTTIKVKVVPRYSPEEVIDLEQYETPDFSMTSEEAAKLLPAIDDALISGPKPGSGSTGP